MSTEENAVLKITLANDNNAENTKFFICHQCHRNFRTHRGLMQHQRSCKVVLHIIPTNNVEEKVGQIQSKRPYRRKRETVETI